MIAPAEPMAQALAALLAEQLAPVVAEAVAAGVRAAVAEQLEHHAVPPRLLSVVEAAELAGVHAETIRRAVKSGRLPAVTSLGRHPRIRAEDLAAFLQPAAAPVPAKHGGRP